MAPAGMGGCLPKRILVCLPMSMLKTGTSIVYWGTLNFSTPSPLYPDDCSNAQQAHQRRASSMLFLPEWSVGAEP